MLNDEINLTLDLTAQCDVCGNDLSFGITNRSASETTFEVDVTPCTDCLNGANDEGYNQRTKEEEDA